MRQTKEKPEGGTILRTLSSSTSVNILSSTAMVGGGAVASSMTAVMITEPQWSQPTYYWVSQDNPTFIGNGVCMLSDQGQTNGVYHLVITNLNPGTPMQTVFGDYPAWYLNLQAGQHATIPRLACADHAEKFTLVAIAGNKLLVAVQNAPDYVSQGAAVAIGAVVALTGLAFYLRQRRKDREEEKT